MTARQGLCLVLFTVVAVSLLPANGSADTILGEMLPVDPLVPTSDTLVVNCTIFNCSDTGYNASDIIFHYGNMSIPATSVEILDECTAELHKPNMTRAMSNIHCYCFVRDRVDKTILRTVDHQVVTVADPPTKPNITECVVYNWESMTCKWEPAEQDTGIQTRQELHWTVLPPKLGYFNSCPRKGNAYPKNWCIWKEIDTEDSFHRDKIYYISVIAENLRKPTTKSTNIKWKISSGINSINTRKKKKVPTATLR